MTVRAGGNEGHTASLEQCVADIEPAAVFGDRESSGETECIEKNAVTRCRWPNRLHQRFAHAVVDVSAHLLQQRGAPRQFLRARWQKAAARCEGATCRLQTDPEVRRTRAECEFAHRRNRVNRAESPP